MLLVVGCNKEISPSGGKSQSFVRKLESQDTPGSDFNPASAPSSNPIMRNLRQYRHRAQAGVARSRFANLLVKFMLSMVPETVQWHYLEKVTFTQYVALLNRTAPKVTRCVAASIR